MELDWPAHGRYAGRMTFARIAVLVLVLAGCGADRTAPAGGRTPGSTAADGVAVPIASRQPEAPKVSTPIPGPTDAPDPRACKVDDDCAVVATRPAADACCDITVTAEAITRAHLQFIETWRRSNCPSSHVCAENDLPGAQMAQECYFGRCVAGTCVLPCNDPTFDRTKAGMLRP